jgi:hypothetical protein
METKNQGPNPPSRQPVVKNVDSSVPAGMIPRYRYSTAAGGWVVVRLSPKSREPLVPSASGFNLITVKVRAILLTLVFIIVAVSAAFAYNLYDTQGVFHDFLAYVLPCLAGVFGGLGIFYPRRASGLFFASAVCLATGIYFYLKAHSQIAVIRLLTLTGIVVATSMFLFWVNMQRNRHNGGGSRWRWNNVACLAVVLLALGLAFFVVTTLPLFSRK